MSTGHDKDRFTVMLACLGDGTKLPPYVVFKRKTLPKNLNFPKEVVTCQVPSKRLDGRNTRAGLVKDRLEQSWWPQQAKVDACLGFVPGALIQTSSQYH